MQIAPMVGDERLRSGGFSIAERSRRGTFWKARGSTHLFGDDEAHEAVDLLTAAGFERSGYGDWMLEGERLTVVQALDFCLRAELICARG